MSGAKKSVLHEGLNTDSTTSNLDLFLKFLVFQSIHSVSFWICAEIVALGGSSHDDSCESEMFCVETGQWTKLPNMTTQRGYGPGAVVTEHGGTHRIFVFGGYALGAQKLDSAEFIELVEEGEKMEWQRIEAKMSTPRITTTAVLLDRDTVVICGGHSGKSLLSSCESFNIHTLTFSPFPDMLEDHCRHAAVHYNGTIVVMGGHLNKPACEQFKGGKEIDTVQVTARLLQWQERAPAS